VLERNAGIKRGLTVEILSLAWVTVEAVVAVWAGMAAHSLALTAWGIDSVIELLAGVGLTALFGWWWVDAATSLGMVYFVVREGLEALEAARGPGHT